MQIQTVELIIPVIQTQRGKKQTKIKADIGVLFCYNKMTFINNFIHSVRAVISVTAVRTCHNPFR